MRYSIAALVSFAAVALAAPMPAPEPPGIPSASSARSLLAGLTVKTPVDDGSYDRDKFYTWAAISGNCNAREYVLKRDGTDVEVDNACEAQSGSWVSPYDGKEVSDAGDLDIDHMVPLKNAWINGADSWTDDKREDFANNVDGPQLWAVSYSSNRSKGDSSPDEWKPPSEDFYCTYASSYIQIKSDWDLSLSSAEKSALTDMLDTC